VYREIIEQHDLFCQDAKTGIIILPGLGYESGGYVPFLTESLSIHAKAASVISSDAGSDVS